MATKPNIIGTLIRSELWDLMDRYDLKVNDRRKYEELHSVVRTLSKSDLGEFLLDLDRERLKQICRELSLDDGGKVKAEIVDRILGKDDDDQSSTRGQSNKLRVLDGLTREELHVLTDGLEIVLPDRLRRESAIEALSKVSKKGLADAFVGLSRDSLKRLCRDLRLDEGGKKKQELVERVLGVRPAEDDDDEPDTETGPSKRKPRLFIGSTVEALPVAREVQAELEHDVEGSIWSQNLFAAGQTTWSTLVAKARDFDFALIVFSGDDAVVSRGAPTTAPRDNVLLEYGLFVGSLGPERTLFLYDRHHKPKIASDLAGVTALTYDGERTDGNLQAAVGPPCTQLRKLLQKLGPRE